jgi:tRNA (guanine-N7-)-methyltransferase
MGKNKLERWHENESFALLHQPNLILPNAEDFCLKGKWHSGFFKNNHPITLELGCGRGEYTIGMAKTCPQRNFIGIDIKGARLWRGAKTAVMESMTNVSFVRTRIEAAERLFAADEISEIWLPFPDPQPTKPNKRMFSAAFFNRYQNFLTQGGMLHLKTDCHALYRYALALLEYNGVCPVLAAEDLYAHAGLQGAAAAAIETAYESMFRSQGKTIAYLQFAMQRHAWQELP